MLAESLTHWQEPNKNDPSLFNVTAKDPEGGQHGWQAIKKGRLSDLFLYQIW